MSRKYSSKKFSELNVDVSKMYVISRPTPLSELTLDDYDQNWRNKARDLIARRSHKLQGLS